MDEQRVFNYEDFKSELKVSGSLFPDLEEAAASLRSNDGYVHVICHDDADGITSGAILTKALLRAGLYFRTTVVPRLDEEIIADLAKDGMDFLLMADIGSGYSDLVERLAVETGARIVVLDHHKVVARSEKFTGINCNDHGMNGSFEASGSVMAFLFACALDFDNIALIDLALAGAAGDKQKIAGFKGFNLELARIGERTGLLVPDDGLELYGTTLEGSLEETYDPFFRGISGRKNEISKFLGNLGIEGSSSLKDLPGNKITALNSALMLRLLEAKAYTSSLDNLCGRRYFSTRMNMYIEEIASVANGCGNLGEHSMALSFCVSPERYRDRAIAVSQEFYRKALNKIIELEEGFESLGSVDVFYAEKDDQASTATGVAIRYLTDGTRPLLGITLMEDKIGISARGTRKLVERKLDLAEALRKAAGEVGGRGGGHPVASGATIPKEGLEKFLSLVDGMVAKQIRK